MVDYVIPGNDDAVRAIKVVLGALTNAIVEVNGGTIVDYVTEDETRKPRGFDRRDNKKFNRRDRDNNRKEFKLNNKKVEKKIEKNVEEPIKEKIAPQELDLSILTVAELREIAKKKEIKGYSKMKKDELIESLK
jgi:hypothetical protein